MANTKPRGYVKAGVIHSNKMRDLMNRAHSSGIPHHISKSPISAEVGKRVYHSVYVPAQHKKAMAAHCKSC